MGQFLKPRKQKKRDVCLCCCEERHIYGRGLCKPCNVKFKHYYPTIPRAYSSAKSVCRECGTLAVCRSLGLCSGCYDEEDIRLRHGGRKGPRKANPITQPKFQPQDPTSARPGSAEKILVFLGRYERREFLFHPGDLTLRPDQKHEQYPSGTRRVHRRDRFREDWA